MKTNTIIITAMAALLLTAPLRAEDKVAPKVDPAELKSVPNISLAEELPEVAKNVGKIVRIRFSGRTAKPTAIEGDNTVVEVTHEILKRSLFMSGAISLVVPPEGAAWLSKIPKTAKTNASEFVYARIVENKKAEALGSKIVNGNLVW